MITDGVSRNSLGGGQMTVKGLLFLQIKSTVRTRMYLFLTWMAIQSNWFHWKVLGAL